MPSNNTIRTVNLGGRGILANAQKPLLIHQRQIIRICLHKSSFEGLTVTNYILIDVGTTIRYFV